MSEIRQNKLNGQWVIYAPGRGERPRDYHRHEKNAGDLPEYEADCPFCPGNEDMIPGILLERPASPPDRWQARVIPNKFPALSPDKASEERRSEGIHPVVPGYGRHEVIIETPNHNHHPPQMSEDEMSQVIEIYHQRLLQVAEEDANLAAILFRNHGLRAGTSLKHPHSQLVVMGIVPPHIRGQESEAQRYFDQHGGCVLCDMLAFELQEGQRLIFENRSFVNFVPFAAEVPFEMWIAPKRHRSSFVSISREEKEDLGIILRDGLKRLNDGLDDPDYNYVFHSSAHFRKNEPHLHWYLQVRPRLTTPAEFEIGSGMRINPSIPEEDADFLREAAKEEMRKP